MPTQAMSDTGAAPLTDLDLRGILGVLWKWRGLLAAGTLIGLGGGMADLLRRQPVYRATARLLVERQGPKMLKFVDADGWVLPQDMPFDTHASLIQTPPVAARVAKATDAQSRPEFAAAVAAGAEMTDGVPTAIVDALLAGLEAKPSQGEIGLVDVSYVAGDPDFAARMANAFAEQYIEDRLESGLGLTEGVRKWIDARLGEQKAKLAQAEEDLQRFREDASFVGPPGGETNARIAALQGTLDETVRAREDAERRWDELRARQESVVKAGAVAEVAGSPQFQELYRERSALLRSISEASVPFGPKHPEMQKLQSRLVETEEALRQEIERLDASQDLEIARWKKREEALRASLRTATAETLASNRRATEYAALEREAELNRELYYTLLRRLKSLGLAMDGDRSNLRIIARARPPGAPFAGPSTRRLLQTIAIGLLLAAGVAFFWEYLDRTVKTPEELPARFRLPLLGVIPTVPDATLERAAPVGGGGGPRLDALAAAPAILADAFSALRSAVVLSAPKTPPQVLLVTSAGMSEGKSTISLHLAAAMARDGVPTLLIEADLRRPVLAERLGLVSVPGLTELLTSRQPLLGGVRKSAVPGLSLLPAGSPAPDPSELLGSERMAELVQEARKSFGRILIDSPPVFAAAETLALADATVLTTVCDGVVLVLRARHTTRNAAARARARLLGVRARLLGGVLNGWSQPGPVRGSGYTYGYRTEARTADPGRIDGDAFGERGAGARGELGRADQGSIDRASVASEEWERAGSPKGDQARIDRKRTRSG